MTILGQVFQTLASGVPVNRVGATLGIDDGLAEACVDHWVRLGLVTPSGSLSLGCTDCAATEGAALAEKPPTCRGCPFSR